MIELDGSYMNYGKFSPPLNGNTGERPTKQNDVTSTRTDPYTGFLEYYCESNKEVYRVGYDLREILDMRPLRIMLEQEGNLDFFHRILKEQYSRNVIGTGKWKKLKCFDLNLDQIIRNHMSTQSQVRYRRLKAWVEDWMNSDDRSSL